jgi:hypothetical protein
MAMRLSVVPAVVCFVGALAISGCTTQSPDPASTSPSAGDLSGVGVDDTYATTVSACLKERGWDVTIRPDGGIDATYPKEQATAYLHDLEGCTNEAGFGGDPGRYSDQDLAELYPEFVEASECLAYEGYDMGDPPSSGVFVDTYYTEQQWDPWTVVQFQVSEERYFELLSICPTPVM